MTINKRGLQMAIEAVQHLQGEERERLLENLRKLSPLVEKAIRSGLFTFEDLVHVDGKGVEALISAVPEEKWAIALRACSQELKLHLLSNLPTRRAEWLKEAVTSIGPQSVSKVQQVQEEIISITQDLAKNGKLVLNKSTDDDPLV